MNKKNRKKGFLSATAVVLVLVAAIVFNLLVTKLDWSYDVSENQMYTMSEQTEQIVKALDKDVTFYVLSSEADYNKIYKKIVNEYADLSKHISIEYKDLENYPNFAYDYIDSSSEEAEDGSVIVVCGDKNRYLSASGFVSYSYNYENYSSSAESLNLEVQLTEAVNYVTADETPIIYTLTGHGETELSSTITGYLKNDNYDVKELNLLSEESVPEDCAVLFVNAPTKDISKEDAKKIKTYLEGEGKLYFVADALTDEIPNFASILDEYGITMEKGVVIEGDSSKYMQLPTYLLPTIETSEITNAIANQYILAPVAKGFTYESDSTEYSTIALLSTSDQAYSKLDTSSNVVEKAKEDIDGPFSVSLAVDTEEGGKVIVLGSANVLLDEIDAAVSGTNSDFVLNGINYLAQQESKISVRAKDITTNYATISAFAQKALMVGTTFVIPGLTLIIGVCVVLRRKRK